MQYLFIISHDDAFEPTDSLFSDIAAWIRRMTRRGVRVHGNPLRPASDAITVRVRDGKQVRSPGPFSRSKEQMCAYELVDCSSLEEALGAAAQHPMARVATIEVRPVWETLKR